MDSEPSDTNSIIRLISFAETKAKLTACDNLGKILKLRDEFILKNALEWFRMMQTRLRSEQHELREDELESILKSGQFEFLPNIMNSGIK